MTQKQSRFLSWILAGVFSLAAGSAGAELPAVTAQLDTHVVALGDRATVRLQLNYGDGQKPERPDIHSWLHGLEPEISETRLPGSVAGEQVWRFDARIQLLGLGEQNLAALPISFVTAAGDTVVRSTHPLTVEVLGVRKEGDLEPRDIKPPVPVPGGWPLWWVAGGGLALLGTVLVLIHRKMSRREVTAATATFVAPVDHAAEFVRIADMGLLESGRYKEYYSLLADNLRVFLQHRLGIDAMELTTQEIVTQLHTRKPEDPSGLIDGIRHFLSTADLVKFARMRPELPAARQAPQAGISLLERIDAEMVSPLPAVGDTTDGLSPAAADARPETRVGGS